MANITTAVLAGYRTDWASFDTNEGMVKLALWDHLGSVAGDQKVVYTKGNTGLGIAQIVEEGSPAPVSTPLETPQLTLTQKRRAMQFGFTIEAQKFDLYGKVKEVGASAVEAVKRAKERDAQALMLINGFDTNYPIATSTSLYSNSHTINGTTLDNLASPTALSESALETAITQLRTQKDSKNESPMYFSGPFKLLVSPNDEFTARKIQKSTQVLGSGDNDANVVRDLFDVVVCEFATSTTAWALVPADKSKHWFKKVVRTPIENIEHEDKDGNLYFTKFSIYALGCELPYNCVGNAGA